MADTVDKNKRSTIMASVGQKNTKPELVVRQILHRMGYRFRLHRKDLPGTPDIVLPKYRTAIYVHGCFWHGHPGCRKAGRPKDNADFWNAKLDRNIERDAQAIAGVEALGWRTLIVWQCQVRDAEALSERLRDFLGKETPPLPSSNY